MPLHKTAITLARMLEMRLAPVGYHVALGGSCLHKERGNDVDLFVYPRDASKQTLTEQMSEVGAILISVGMERTYNVDEVRRAWRKSGSSDTKTVEVWCYKDKKVDIFHVR